jgi:hypothetical protein
MDLQSSDHDRWLGSYKKHRILETKVFMSARRRIRAESSPASHRVFRDAVSPRPSRTAIAEALEKTCVATIQQMTSRILSLPSPGPNGR